MRRVLIVAAVAALLLAPVFWLPSPAQEEAIGPVGAVMEDVNVVSREKGRILWSLRTSQASITGDSETASLSGVDVEFPAENMTVSARAGLYKLTDGALHLSGNVQAVTGDYVLATESASFDPASGAVESKDRVIMEGKSLRIVAKGFRAQGEKVWLLNGVKAELY